MPTISQSELPVPKSWDEFEDIVAELYSRIWDDPNVQRYGRSGQSQQGVDIYGQPKRLGGGYAAIQCKRCAPGSLTVAIVEEAVLEAEVFLPPLAEYTIATTHRRDSRLQQAVRRINRERQRGGEFPVRIVFWEDICHHLSHPNHTNLLRKYYGDWLARLSAASDDLPDTKRHFDVVGDRLLELELSGITQEQKRVMSRELDRLMWHAVGRRNATDALLIQKMQDRLKAMVRSDSPTSSREPS